MAETCRIVVMASGNGSNFQALIDAVASGSIPDSTITRLYVNRQTAFAIQRAEKAGIPHEYFNLIKHGFQAKGEKDPEKLREARARYDAALSTKILETEPRPHLIVLAGWMYVFGDSFLDPVRAQGIQIINLHPALPGRYDGVDAIDRAFNDFKAGKLELNKTGIMIHHVIQEVDRGDVIMLREIECRPDEDLDQLKERVHGHEHELIVEATAKIVKEIMSGNA
ncbi:phosphoribosylglycinamide formyltransferase [Xylariomycetidae sp. FL2044]|nr:phosphoribosylglycinamide formyltransferase [Xylariomycetidae sp. FL2044]